MNKLLLLSKIFLPMVVWALTFIIGIYIFLWSFHFHQNEFGLICLVGLYFGFLERMCQRLYKFSFEKISNLISNKTE